MAKNNNSEPQDNSLEALLFEQNKQMKENKRTDDAFKAKGIESTKEILKNIKAIYTPVSKAQTLLTEFNKNQSNVNKTIQSEIAKNSELLKQNVSNSKSLYALLEKTFVTDKKQQVTSSSSKGGKSEKKNDNFDNKARHEAGILGEDDRITPILSSINKNMEEMIKLLQEKKKEDNAPKPPEDSGWNMPKLPKFMDLLIPAIVAAVAMRHDEVGNATKAAVGAGTAAARAAAPIVEAAKAGAATVTGVSKLGAAAEAARTAMTMANMKAAFTGASPVGTMGKVGAGLGVGATLGRLHEGDYAGATAQGISTLLPLILAKTKYGKMASLAAAGIDVGLLGRDYVNYTDKKEAAEAEGKTIKSPLEYFKDDVKTVGAFFGIGNGPDKVEENTKEAIDPVVQNTSETNKILAEIRDGKVDGAAAQTAAKSGGDLFAGSSSMLGTAVVGGLLAHRFGLFSKLAGGVASTGLGARVGAGLSGLGSSIGANAGRLGAAGLSAAGTIGKKALGKLIPGVGLYMGATGAYDKIKEGDWTGAALEGGSGIASLIPGIGTAVAIGLQGISATRDVIKATNDSTTQSIQSTNTAAQSSLSKSVSETNKNVTDSANNLNASILSGAQSANKQIVDTSKTANDSLTKSATTLTTTSTSLSEQLLKASTTLLGMIGKMTPAGMAMNAGKGLYNWAFGESPTVNENAQSYGSAMNKNRAGNQMMVYKSFLNAGMSPQQARIFTAEIGRENSYNPNEMFGSHTDDSNGLTNVGMLSWQKDRADKFMKFMKANGQIDEKGKIKWGQASLDAQARFIKEELAGSYYNKAGNKFLNNKDISYAEGTKLLGKDYIGWRYDDPKYASGHERRDRYYATLNEQLRNGTPIQPHAPTDPKKKNVKYISKQEMEKLSKPAPKPGIPLGQPAMQAWEKAEKVRVAELQKTQKGILSGAIVVGSPPKETKVSTVATPPKRDAENKNFDKPDNKEFYALGQKNVVIQNGVDMAGLQPNVRTKFFTMVGELFATKGAKGKVVVTSAYRSPAKQQQLWNQKLKENGGDEAKTRKYVAPPGTSNHEKGLALDLDTKGSNNVALLDSSGLLGKYGFSRPLSHEPWHIEYGSGKASGVTASTAMDASADEDGPVDVGQVFSEGLAAVLNSDAMNSVREFMKGSIDKPVDKYGPPVAQGHFSKDESDPTRVKPKDSGNGEMWENLDQQLGDGKLHRQERNADYEKVKKAFGGDGSIKRQERDWKEYNKVKKALGGSSAIFRQIGGGKYSWLADIFGGLFGEDDSLLGSLFGILTGSQDIAGLGNVLGKHITGRNPELDGMGAFGGGFGGGLAENNIQTSGDFNVGTDINSMGGVGGGFGGGLTENNNVVETTEHLDGSVTKTNSDGSYSFTNKDGQVYNYDSSGNVITSTSENNNTTMAPEENVKGTVTQTNEDGSYTIAGDDGRIYNYNSQGQMTSASTSTRTVNYNADGTIASIDRNEDAPISRPSDSSTQVSGEIAEGGFMADTSDGMPGLNARLPAGMPSIPGLQSLLPSLPGVGDILPKLGGMVMPSFGGGIDLSQAMGGFGGGIAGGLSYDDTFNRYEDHEFEQAKEYQRQDEQSKMQVQVTVPEADVTPTSQAPQGGKSSQPGLSGQPFTRNPDSVIQQVAFAMMRTSVG